LLSLIEDSSPYVSFFSHKIFISTRKLWVDIPSYDFHILTSKRLHWQAFFSIGFILKVFLPSNVLLILLQHYRGCFYGSLSLFSWLSHLFILLHGYTLRGRRTFYFLCPMPLQIQEKKKKKILTHYFFFIYIGFYSSSHLTELKKNLTSTTVAWLCSTDRLWWVRCSIRCMKRNKKRYTDSCD
jgi:hypothetical protein